MVDELRLAIEHARELPDAVQRYLAAQMEEWMDAREWDATVSSPDGRQRLARLVAEARAEIARGEVEDGGFGR